MLPCRVRAHRECPSGSEFSGEMAGASASRRVRRWEGPLVLGALVVQAALTLGFQSGGAMRVDDAPAARSVQLAGDVTDVIGSFWDWLFGPGETTPPPPPPPPPEGEGW